MSCCTCQDIKRCNPSAVTWTTPVYVRQVPYTSLVDVRRAIKPLEGQWQRDEGLDVLTCGTPLVHVRSHMTQRMWRSPCNTLFAALQLAASTFNITSSLSRYHHAMEGNAIRQ
eukprot:2269835-Amphidinium_carterae.1